MLRILLTHTQENCFQQKDVVEGFNNGIRQVCNKEYVLVRKRGKRNKQRPKRRDILGRHVGDCLIVRISCLSLYFQKSYKKTIGFFMQLTKKDKTMQK